MINYDEIGLRIMMARKRRRLSQERVAEDLGLYQADISNLEKNKKGSGITDLSKLEMIADYFDMPLTQLLLGISGTDVEQGKDGNEMTNEEKIAKFKDLLSCEAMGEGLASWDEYDGYDRDWMRKHAETLRPEVDLCEYSQWKNEYIEAEYQRLKDCAHLITIHCQDADGHNYQETNGQYLALYFLSEINSREDLTFTGIGTATEEETKQFIAEGASDEAFRDAWFEEPRGLMRPASENDDGGCVNIPDDPDEEIAFN